MFKIEQEIRQYNIGECISFKKTTEKFGGLSNMAGGYSIVINGIFIRSSEALYQAMKYTNYPEIQMEIINQTSPMTAKMISKKYKEYIRNDWENIKVPIMKWSLRIKLCQNINTFGKLLLETKDLSIVEESKKDKFWGATKINNSYKGANVLGRLLMELRELFKQYHFDTVSPLSLDNFCLNGKEITLVKQDDKNSAEVNNGLFQ